MPSKTALVRVAASPLALSRAVERAAQVEDVSAPRTREAYAKDWERFEEWASSAGVDVHALTAPEVKLYLGYLASEGQKIKSVERAYAGIVFSYRARGGAWDREQPLIRNFFKALRRARAGVEEVRKVAPILAADLRRMVAAQPDTLAGRRNRALLAIGWAGAMRRSELAALDVGDVDFVAEGVILRIRKSKTNQEGRLEEKAIASARDAACCPVALLRAWLADVDEWSPYGGAGRAVFQNIRRGGHLTGKRLTGHAVALLVKSSARAVGLDADDFAGHSMRSGLMTSAAQAGASLQDIMRQSGHRTERIAAGYIRHASLFQNNVTKGLL